MEGGQCTLLARSGTMCNERMIPRILSVLFGKWLNNLPGRIDSTSCVLAGQPHAQERRQNHPSEKVLTSQMRVGHGLCLLNRRSYYLCLLSQEG